MAVQTRDAQGGTEPPGKTSGENSAAASKRSGGPPAERLREQLERELGEIPPESPSEPMEREEPTVPGPTEAGPTEAGPTEEEATRKTPPENKSGGKGNVVEGQQS